MVPDHPGATVCLGRPQPAGQKRRANIHPSLPIGNQRHRHLKTATQVPTYRIRRAQPIGKCPASYWQMPGSVDVSGRRIRSPVPSSKYTLPYPPPNREILLRVREVYPYPLMHASEKFRLSTHCKGLTDLTLRCSLFRQQSSRERAPDGAPYSCIYEWSARIQPTRNRLPIQAAPGTQYDESIQCAAHSY